MQPGWGSVLVVDDDPAMGLYVSRQLRPLVESVAIAQSGPEALELFRTHAFDLMLLDIIMPKMNGYQVLEAIRADASQLRIPILVISAADDLEGVVRCIELGAEDYLVKPLNPVLLNARVTACLERKWLRDQEQAYLRQLEAEKAAAETANRAKSIFLANMSHELRTPLNAIIGYSEMLQEDVEAEGCGNLVPDLQKIRQSGKHLLGIVNDILDISKLEAGRVDTTPTTFAVAALLDDVVQQVQPLVVANGNRLIIRSPEPSSAAPLTLHTDWTKVRQVLLNLLSNAAKFTHNGTITLTVDPPTPRAPSPNSQPSHITFGVTDTGIGIPPEQQQRIFQAFTQADDSKTRRYGGTGLGLAISYRYSELLGGRLTVDSAPQQGTRFALTLPVDLPQIHAARLESMQPQSGATAGLVLVIDNDRAVRDWMVHQLNQQGCRVITAWSGQEGLRLARDLRPDWIVLDLLMPGLDGWGVLATLKAEPDLADIPVMVMATETGATPSGYLVGWVEVATQPSDAQQIEQLLRRLPLSPTSASPAPASDATAAAEFSASASDALESQGNSRVLLLHGDANLRCALAQQWQQAGWEVVATAEAEVALAAAIAHPPRAVVLDLLSLGKDGFQQLEQFQAAAAGHQSILAIANRDLTPADQSRLNGRLEQWLQQQPQQGQCLTHSIPALILKPGISSAASQD
ncbi:MAG: response regulator [Kaiparowitsia implicata GSE-PSE-MK54-09C]|jgi:signal transduction histidine kinase|nr:response regulator [Kaiparowitsia implicata GSE-PSE-MK54-09C]